MDRVDLTGGNAAIGSGGVRPEIQGLRAIAVSAVVLFHVWPQIAPGGYVGVDVFFVISGFLITSLLLREVEQSKHIALGSFYWRRVWRLLPMALFVIFIVAALTPALLPPSQWKGVISESVASAFYFENWWLAALSVDYLGAEQAPSPLQHYWSLSVEEQFYILWPAILIAGLWAANRFRTPLRNVLGPAFIAMSALSLTLSVLAARYGGAGSYFFTHTRIWELGLGGLLAVWPPDLAEKWRSFCGFLGLAAILAAVFGFSAQTHFPGYAALLPTLGAALVILSGRAATSISAFGLLKMEPFQVLGDLSYPIYLWHWPLVIFYRMSGHSEIGLVAGLVILATTIGLSVLSKRYVEDRFRKPVMTSLWWRKAVPFTALLLLPLPLWVWSYHQIGVQRAAIAAAPNSYPGAMALVSGGRVPENVGLSPPLALLRFDKDPAYDNGCHLEFSQSEPVACRFGDPKGRLKVFLIGDSHAVNWLPALRLIAARQGWNAASYTKSSCALMPVMMGHEGKPYEECFEWGQKMMALLARERPGLVILTQMRAAAPYGSGQAALRQSMTRPLVALWRKIERLGARVAVIADTPQWPIDPDVCLFEDKACALHIASTHTGDPLIDAARSASSVLFVDLNDYLCPRGVCPAVIGNVIVWRDRHHLTATYARSTAPLLEMQLGRRASMVHTLVNWQGNGTQ